MEQSINIILLGIALTAGAGSLCLAFSPTALQRIGSRMRARSQAMIAAHNAYTATYRSSMAAKEDRAEIRKHLFPACEVPTCYRSAGTRKFLLFAGEGITLVEEKE